MNEILLRGHVSDPSAIPPVLNESGYDMNGTPTKQTHVNPLASTRLQKIGFTVDRKYAAIDADLLLRSVNLATRLNTQQDVHRALSRQRRGRLVGMLVMALAGALSLGSMIDAPDWRSSLPTLLVCAVGGMLGYLLTEVSTRTLRLLQPITLNKWLDHEVRQIAEQVPEVQEHLNRVRMNGMTLRVFHVPGINAIIAGAILEIPAEHQTPGRP